MRKPRPSPLLGIALTGVLCVWLIGCTNDERTTTRSMDANKPVVRDREHLSEPLQTSAEGKNAGLNSGTAGSRYEVDINSGDYRTNWWPGDPSAQSDITTSRLSREIRRLGLDTTTPPVWKPASREPYIPGEMGFDYAGAVQVGGSLVGFLVITSASDDERRVILADFMKSLRTQPPAHVMNDGYVLIEKLLSQRGMDILNYYPDPSAFQHVRAKLRDAVNHEAGDNPK